jgi:hypothetical protein
MFTMGDAWEMKDPVLGKNYGYVYPRSLLYLVSGAFEERAGKPYVDAPLLGMQRFLRVGSVSEPDQVAAAAKIAAFFQGQDRDVVYAPTDDVTMSDSHGGFDNEPCTLASVARMCASR